MRRFVQLLFNPEARAWHFVERCQITCEQHAQRNPEIEPHQLLGHLWSKTRRIRWHGKDPALRKPAFVATYFYACLPPSDGARALGLAIALSAYPKTADKYPALGQEYDRLMEPVFEAQRNGGLHTLYAKHNPRLAAETQWEAK